MISFDVRQGATIGKFAYAVTIESAGDGDWIRIMRSGEGVSIPLADLDAIMTLIGNAVREFAQAKAKLGTV